MVNNYRRGAERERKLVNRFRELGWIALRSAGSHSPIDVVAINPNTKEIRLIQSKLGKLYPKEKEEILKTFMHLAGTYIVVPELDNYDNGKYK